MALRLRRGTDAERLLITPVQGELIYTTDTKKLYIGDGTTVGGRLVEGAGSPDLAGLDDINVAGAINGQVLAYDTATLKWIPSTPATSGTGDGVVEGSNYQINIIGYDSSIMVDTDALQVTANLNGDSFGTHIGPVVGDVKGSVFADDSSLLVDGTTGEIRGPVNAPSVEAGNIKLTSLSSDNTMFLRTNGDGNFFIISTEDSAGTVLITSNAQVGAPLDPVERTFTLFNSSTNAAEVALAQIHNTDTGPGGSIGILRSRGSKTVPTAVQSGDAIGTFITAGFNGSDYRSAGGIRITASGAPQAAYIPSNVEILTSKSDGTNEVKLTVKNTGETVFTGAATLVTYADNTARDAAITSPVAGMIVFNTTNTKFQGYTGAAWVDLN